jgi:hypothetical protein
VNPEKTKYMLISCYQKAGQKHGIKIANKSFEDVSKFKYMEITLTYQNCMHEELRADKIQGMLATIGSESFVFPPAV